jgi:hypothetical protein
MRWIAGGLLVVVIVLLMMVLLVFPADAPVEPPAAPTVTPLSLYEREATIEFRAAATLDEQMRRGEITPIYGTPPATYTLEP